MRTAPLTAVLLLATASAGSAAGQALPALEHVRRIGCLDCRGPELFGEIADLALTPNGTVYVLTMPPPIVRGFDANGKVILATGRQGRGPGEYAAPSFLSPLSDTTFQVIDVITRRVMRLDAKGNETAFTAMPNFPIAAHRSPGSNFTIAAITDFRSPTLTVQRWRDGAQTPETVLKFGPEFPRRSETEPSTFISFAVNARGEFAVGDGNFEYRIAVYDSTGRKLREITRDIPLPMRSQAEMQYEEDRRKRNADQLRAKRGAERGGGPGGQPPISPTKAHFQSLAFVYDDEGRLWVLTRRGSLTSTVFDVFSPAGQYLGEVKVPERLLQFDIRGRVLAAVSADENDVQGISLYRMR